MLTKAFGKLVDTVIEMTWFPTSDTKRPFRVPWCYIFYDPPADSDLVKQLLLSEATCPAILHFPSTQVAEATGGTEWIRPYVYANQERGFAIQASPSYNKSAAQLAYTRTLQVLRDDFGPKFDLEKVYF